MSFIVSWVASIIILVMNIIFEVKISCNYAYQSLEMLTRNAENASQLECRKIILRHANAVDRSFLKS